MKKISLITSLMIILFSNVTLATTVTTDYEGSGDFLLQTTILSPVAPSITDSATIHTGCEGGCCCCPDCYGEYEGTQIVTNNPFSASAHTATVNEGCIEIEQYYYDEFNDYSYETSYYTFFNGTGTAESIVYVVPGEAVSYQLANGTGISYVSFSQIVFLDYEFDYSTTYGGGVWACSPGYAGLMNYYSFYNQPVYYNTQLGLYCSPVDESSLYAFLFATTTDNFGLSSSLFFDSVEYYQNIEAEGSSDYGFTTTTDPSYIGDVDFDFEMELG